MRWIKVTIHDLTVRTAFVAFPGGVTEWQALNRAREAVEMCASYGNVTATDERIEIVRVEAAAAPNATADTYFEVGGLVAVLTVAELRRLIYELPTDDPRLRRLRDDLQAEMNLRADPHPDQNKTVRARAMAKLSPEEREALGLQ